MEFRVKVMGLEPFKLQTRPDTQRAQQEEVLRQQQQAIKDQQGHSTHPYPPIFQFAITLTLACNGRLHSLTHCSFYAPVDRMVTSAADLEAERLRMLASKAKVIVSYSHPQQYDSIPPTSRLTLPSFQCSTPAWMIACTSLYGYV